MYRNLVPSLFLYINPLVAIVISLMVGFCTSAPNIFSTSDSLNYLSIYFLIHNSACLCRLIT